MSTRIRIFLKPHILYLDSWRRRPWTAIHHLHISQNAPYLPSKFCISIVFNFPWDGCNTQGEMENKGYAKFWRANKLLWEMCNGEWREVSKHCCLGERNLWFREGRGPICVKKCAVSKIAEFALVEPKFIDSILCTCVRMWDVSSVLYHWPSLFCLQFSIGIRF